MIVLVYGGRDYTDAEAVYYELDEARAWQASHDGREFTEVCTGGATGADTLGVLWACEHDVFFFVLPADWARHGRYRAGPLRNERLLCIREPALAIQFPGGRGTADMRRRCDERKIPVDVIGSTQ